MTHNAITQTQVLKVLDLLAEAYPEAECALVYQTPWQLLVATILSAQCTDSRVNQVTPELFKKYSGVTAMAAARIEDVEKVIRSTGFFRNKAKNLVGCARTIVERHAGNVPKTMAELSRLPGVGRKTANVVLGNAFGVPGMVVDTHVGRIARRLGWTTAKQADHVERDLCGLLPQNRWTQTSHILIFHGRQCCRAQTAWCSRCPVLPYCPQQGVARPR